MIDHPREEKELRGKFAAARTRIAIVAGMGLLLSLCGWLVVLHWENRVADLEFQARAGNVTRTLQTGFNEHLAKLAALRALFEASENGVSRQEFRHFTSRFMESHPAILSMSWIPRVRREERAGHEAEAVRDGIAGYEIRTLTPGEGLVRNDDQTDYFPVYYTTEKRDGDAVYGLDLGDAGIREDALIRARDGNEAAASRSFTLQTESGSRQGFFVMLPLYERGLPHRTPEERRANIAGFVQAVFQVDGMVQTIRSGIRSPVDFYLYPANADSGTQPIYPCEPRTGAANLPPPDAGTHLPWSQAITIADRKWTVVARPAAPAPLGTYLTSSILLAAGLLVTAVGVALLWSSARHNNRLLAVNKAMARLTLTNSMTGLPNRRAFFERLNAELPQHPVTVFFIDIDHLKNVNDTLGHSTGDQLLMEAARRLQGLVATDGMVGRFGGDEFAILRPGPVSRNGIHILADRIIETLGGQYLIGDSVFTISASVGVACAARGEMTAESLVMQADLALHRAKEDGRNCFRFYDSAVHQKFREHVTLADDLRLGIERGELMLHYQPQVEISSGKLIGVEALVRWQHPRRGVVPPSVFIPIAEKTGMIASLGQWVFEEACRQIKVWESEGIAPALVGINLSALQCRNAGLVDEFRHILSTWRVDPKRIELELTESVLMDDAIHQQRVVEGLKSIGLRIAIDDFGTGYSSLNYLATYPVDRLKIAQELVFGVTRELRHDLVVKAAVRLAHELGVEVIAEGVETEAQARFLVAAECRQAQGHFFSRPLTAEDTTALLRVGRIDLFSRMLAQLDKHGNAGPRLRLLQA